MPTSRSTPPRTCPRSHPTASCSRRCPNAATRVMRSSARRSTRCRSGARVATGSVRRRAQLAAARPDLTFAELRGNVDTRLEKASQHDAIVLAAAGLDRLGRGDRITERLDTSLMLPMVGQGALAVECRADDARHAGTARRDRRRRRARRGARRARVPRRARRRVLAAVRGVRDRATVTHVTIDALLAALDGSVVVRARATNCRPGEGGSRGREARSSSTVGGSCSPRDRLPRRRGARGSGPHHGARRRACSRAPTSSSTTGSSRPRSWTSRHAAPS